MTSIHSILADVDIAYSILNCVKDEVFIYDMSGRLVYVNEAGEISEGYRLEEKKGESLFSTYNFEDDIRLERSPAYLSLTEHRNIEDMLCVYHIGETQKKKIISTNVLRKDEEPVAILVIQHDKKEIYDLLDENLSLQHQISSQRLDYIRSGHDPFADIPAFGENMKQSLKLARKAVNTESTVMLYGEAGSGRNLIARAIHDSSSRAGHPFISFNCSHFSTEMLDSMIFGSVDSSRNRDNVSGLMTKANGGTIYLEEISNLSGVVQSKLLRFIETGGRFMPLGGTEEQSADVRIICSSQFSSLELIRENLIQIRLFYCLSVFYIPIPSMRERTDEIPELVDFYVKEYCRKLNTQIGGVEPDVMSFFKIFEWPGNLIQFRKCIEAMVNLSDDGDVIGVEDIPVNMLYGTGVTELSAHSVAANHKQEKEVKKEKQQNEVNTGADSEQMGIGQPALTEPVSELLSQISYNSEYASRQRKLALENSQREEKKRIVEALQRNNGNITHTAEELEISRQLLYYRIKKYKIIL